MDIYVIYQKIYLYRLTRGGPPLRPWRSPGPARAFVAETGAECDRTGGSGAAIPALDKLR